MKYEIAVLSGASDYTRITPSEVFRDFSGGLLKFVVARTGDTTVMVLFETWRDHNHANVATFMLMSSFTPLGGGFITIYPDDTVEFEWNSMSMRGQLGFDRPDSPKERAELFDTFKEYLHRK